MLIPGTAGQILAIVLLILPGFVFTAVRARLRGPTPSDGDIGTRILTSIAFGLILDALYVLCLGRFLTDRLFGSEARRDELAAHPRTTVLLAVGLLVLMPIVLAWLDDRRSRSDRLRYKGGYDQTPTAWDYVGPTRGGVFVRVRQPSGAWTGGWVGEGSYLSTWPEPRDLFVETQWRMAEDGAFVEPIPNSRGVYISCADGVTVEWIDVPDGQPDDEAEGAA